ncbi:hypothetical protein HMPREF3212_01544 [Citrobacter freundii]|nr:hypothetical protein HMPREF3212_01544 [Citrobacter freundii]
MTGASNCPNLNIDPLPQSVGRIRRSRRHPALKCLMATLARFIRPTTVTNE